MPFEEICKLIAQRLLQGCMNHQQFANYYDFLGLQGYKLFHEYHFFEQMIGYREFITYFIQHENKLIPQFSSETLTSTTLIPKNWYDYSRIDVDANTRRNAIKNGLQKYLRWERQTKSFLEEMCSQSIQQGYIGVSIQIKKYICSVEKEIEKAQKTYLEIKATDYDLPTVVAKQQFLIKKYSKKLDEIKQKRKESDHVKSSRD